MQLLFKVILIIPSIAILLVTVHALLAPWAWPQHFIRIMDGPPGSPYDIGWQAKARLYLYWGAAFIGIGWCAYAATYSMLWWLPDSWGQVDEDGKWHSVKSIVSFVVAMYVSFTGIPALYEVCQLRLAQKR